MLEVRPAAEGSPNQPHVSRLKRTGLLIATTLVSVNIWTGAPVLALWVGSRVVGHRTLTMGAVFLVVLLLALFVGALAFVLTWLNGRYDNLVERTGGRRVAPWLRSMRAEDQEFLRAKQGTTAVEWIIMASTVVAILCLEVWFFFFAGSPLPK
jgi:hypothetical protein